MTSAARTTVFGLSVEDFGLLALTGDDAPLISSMCTVFAETEATTLMARGVSPANIALGLHRAVVARTMAMLGRVGLTAPLVFVGGVARNPCIVRLLADAQGQEPLLPAEPDLTGALGAISSESLTRPPVASARSCKSGCT